jgi:signal transduction histidine kinase
VSQASRSPSEAPADASALRRRELGAMLRVGGVLFAASAVWSLLHHGASLWQGAELAVAALIFLAGHAVARGAGRHLHAVQVALTLLCVGALALRGWRSPAETPEALVGLLLVPLVCGLLLWERVATLALVVLACAGAGALLLHGTGAPPAHWLPAWWWRTLAISGAFALYRVWRSGTLQAAAAEEGEGDFRRLAQALVEGALVRHRSEPELLRAAAVLLRAHQLTAFFMLLEGDRIRMGPHSFPPRRTDAMLKRMFGDPGQWRFEVLPHFRQLFAERRGKPRPDLREELARVLPPGVLRTISRVVPQVAFDIPLFVDGQPYGLLVLRVRRLSAARIALLELFAKHVEAAVENVRHLERARAHLFEREQLEAELLAKERLAALGEAAGVVAHEVRNPLGVLSNGLALLARQPPTSPGAAEVLGFMRAETERLDHLVRDLLLLARPLEARPAPLELPHVLARVAHAAAQAPALAGRPLQLDVGALPGPLLADGPMLEMALLNLVLNAAQASPEGRPVVLGAQEAAGRLELHVDDEGPGVPAELRARIFEPFFTTRSSGTGLGLSIVRRVVLAHGGTLEVQDRPGGGTRMAIGLPLTPAAASRPAAAA